MSAYSKCVHAGSTMSAKAMLSVMATSQPTVKRSLPGKRFHDAILTGKHSDGIVVVDEQGFDGRRCAFIQNHVRQVEDVDRAGTGGDQIRTLQPLDSFRKCGAGFGDQAATGDAELSHQSRESENCANAGAAVAVALQTIADGDRRRGQLVIRALQGPGCQPRARHR